MKLSFSIHKFVIIQIVCLSFIFVFSNSNLDMFTKVFNTLVLL
jgi:hypothetical protein